MSFKIGKNCKIHPSAIINVEEGSLGDGSIVNEHARIEGRKIIIGREAFIDRLATIGGGSCFDPLATLVAGDWLHMGVNSHINIACGVFIGHEFGCGIETKVFTHGAYSDSYNLGAPTQWAPVTIGNNVWCPNAWINPGVQIGDQVVIAARSLVNKDLPSHCLAGGIPAKVLQQNYLPQQINKKIVIEKIINQTLIRLTQNNVSTFADKIVFNLDSESILVSTNKGETVFNLKNKTIQGNEFHISSVLKDQLRRNGIRFRYEWLSHQPTEQWSAWL
jgi:acetyltransferase-like isoleucine patch superfamily enzyme